MREATKAFATTTTPYALHACERSRTRLIDERLATGNSLLRRLYGVSKISSILALKRTIEGAAAPAKRTRGATE